MERERDRQQERPSQGKEKDLFTVKWRVGGREAEELSVKRGTKVSDFLRERGHENLLRKRLFRNGNLVSVDEKGNLLHDIELQQGDILVLFESEIVKGFLRVYTQSNQLCESRLTI